MGAGQSKIGRGAVELRWRHCYNGSRRNENVYGLHHGVSLRPTGEKIINTNGDSKKLTTNCMVGGLGSVVNNVILKNKMMADEFHLG